MASDAKSRSIFLLIAFLFVIGLVIFYVKYVPLVKYFQIALLIPLALTFVLTIFDLKWGILCFLFVLPLINNIPYFFGIHGEIPHAPTALVLFLFFFAGWLFRSCIRPPSLSIKHALFKPIVLLALVISLSALITFLRFANFYPFLSERINELVVNVNGVRAGGAIMSTVFAALSYITGFVFFFLLFHSIKTKKFIQTAFIVMSVSILLSLVFALIQIYVSPSIGNSPFWISMGRINSTFKDPNSFGMFLSALFPLFLGMTLMIDKKLKYFFILILGFSLFVFPAIGSRSSLMSLVISVILFFLLFFIWGAGFRKKKIVYLFSILLIALLLVLPFIFFSQTSNLYKRMERSLDEITDKDAIRSFFTKRLDFWPAAAKMIRDYPVTGVGIGAYIIELPNYLKRMQRPFKHTDSVENYFLQVWAELGSLGFLLMIWLFVGIFGLVKKSLRACRSEKNDGFMVFGLIAGLAAVMVGFLFHTYIGNFEIIYLFWFLVAAICVNTNGSELDDIENRHTRLFKMAGIILLVVFGAVHLWHSTRSLSISSFAEKFDWPNDFGLYEQEKDKYGIQFHWTRKSAGITVRNLGDRLVIPMMASHPDMDKDPVDVKVYLGDPRFRKKELIGELELTSETWVKFGYRIPESAPDRIVLLFETNRAWQPLKDLNIPDPRWLAIKLGEPWFKYPDKMTVDTILGKKTVSHSRWEGKFHDRLFGNGQSSLRFIIERENCMFQLHIRGQKAHEKGPYIIIRIDDRIVCKTVIESEDWTSVVFSSRLGIGEHRMSVEFTNDVDDKIADQDRNIFLGDLEIVYYQGSQTNEREEW